MGKDSVVQPVLGEVTDSKVPAQSADLIICARIIEYLFWPERLAEEIKRIARPGARYFVTFPAQRSTEPSSDGSPPDRCRHYFVPEEIREWAATIGPGQLLGVQYDEAEPRGGDAEQRYRDVEEHPPQGMCPTNWVYIGTVEQAWSPPVHRAAIPLSSVRFRLPTLRRYYLRIRLKAMEQSLPPRVRRLARVMAYKLRTLTSRATSRGDAS